MFPRIIIIAVVDTYLVVKLGDYIKPLQIPMFFKVLIGVSFAVAFAVLCVYFLYLFHKKTSSNSL